MARVVAIKNWEQFQHYKDRDPPWIKLYRDTLTSEVWVLGTDTSRLVQIASTLLAARYKNRIPLKWALWKGVAHLDCTEEQFMGAIAHLQEHKFFEIHEDNNESKQSASTVLATCSSEGEKSREEQRERRADQTRAREEQPASKALAKRYTDPEQHAHFQAFRETFPRVPCTGKVWQDAEHAYRNLLDEGTDPETIRANTALYAQQKAATGERPHNPDRWLKDGHWRGPFDVPPRVNGHAVPERTWKPSAEDDRLASIEMAERNRRLGIS